MYELLFEIGCEELPAKHVDLALAHLRASAGRLRDTHQLEISGDIRVYGTPRRLALSITGLPARASTVEELVTGPPVSAGQRAAEGFAKKNGAAPEQLIKQATPKGEYFALHVKSGGGDLATVLKPFLEQLLAAIPFPRSMRWGDQDVKFSRPVQWLVAVLHGQKSTEVIPVRLGALEAQSFTRGHRFEANEPFKVGTRQQYLDALRERRVFADVDTRRARVLDEARRAAKDAGGYLFYDPEGPKLPVDPLLAHTYFESLLDEVTNLCEAPVGVHGSFDPSALALPREVILSAMRGHQRYFAVVDANGTLLPAFVTIAATRVKDSSLVRRGNERVLKARLNDGEYFFREDRKRTLASRVADLKTVTYHKKLGSSWDKIERVLELAFILAGRLGHDGSAAPSALDLYVGQSAPGGFYGQLGRAVALSKADLTTLMVGEFPDLQGMVGAQYARLDHEPEAVATAIADHYRPRAAEDAVAKSELAAIVAVADKLDTITGIIGIGQQPSGSSDPFALRRAALGVIRTLLEHRWHLDLAALAKDASRVLMDQHKKIANDTEHKVHAFFEDRFVNLMLPSAPGVEAEAVRAAVAAGLASPIDAAYRIEALQQLTREPEFEAFSVALKRVLHILKTVPEGDVDPALFRNPAEGELHRETQGVIARRRPQEASAALYLERLKEVARIRPFVDKLFDGVMVMDPDEQLRLNRLKLLRDVAQLVQDIADFEKL